MKKRIEVDPAYQYRPLGDLGVSEDTKDESAHVRPRPAHEDSAAWCKQRGKK